MSAAGRILGIDPGSVRIGVAISDPSAILARGLDSIRAGGLTRDVEAITRLVREHEVVAIVVGYPRNLDGSPGPLTEPAERLARGLESATGLPVHLWDERLTSVQAERTLIQADVRREQRRELRDRVAATLILQGFLDRRSLDESPA